MVLTGKQALDYSGGVSAEDNFGIGGYERVMGPNGQAQYWAPDLAGACERAARPLRAHLRRARASASRAAPRPPTRSTATSRDSPHAAPGSDLRDGRRGLLGRDEPRPQEAVRHPLGDARGGRPDHAPLERWAGMRDAEIAVVWDAHLGGRPVAMLGIESRPLPRHGPCPPTARSSGRPARCSRSRRRRSRARSTPRAAAARSWCSPTSRASTARPSRCAALQLEYGAEIGRAVVNFDGPIVFCVVSRYHGGAFVVFSQRLNDNLETVALEGSHASVIGGAPAAAVVFAQRGRQRRTRAGPADRRARRADRGRRGRRAPAPARRARRRRGPRCASEKLGELAAEFDRIHSVERARRGRLGRAASSRRPPAAAVPDRRRRARHRAARSSGPTRAMTLAGLADPLAR